MKNLQGIGLGLVIGLAFWLALLATWGLVWWR